MCHDGQRGFSLLDLLVTMTVIVLLGAAIMPSAVNSMRSMRRGMAVRQVLSDLRQAQSLSVNRKGVFALEWGPAKSRAASEYRIVRDLTGSCEFPGADASEDGLDVVQAWFDLNTEYPTVSIGSVRDRDGHPVQAILFDSMGASVSPCGTASFPLTVTVTDGSGKTTVIEVGKSGFARRQS